MTAGTLHADLTPYILRAFILTVALDREFVTLRAPRTVALAVLAWLVVPASVWPEAWARDTVIITHANAPLGKTLADAKHQFPRCALSDDDGDDRGYGVSPLTGYWPLFPEILPTLNGSFLGSPRGAMFSKVPISGGLAPTLDDSVLKYVSAWCGDPNDSDAPQYDFVVFQSKIMVVIKLAADRAKPSAEAAMDDLAGSLIGQRGSMHHAISLADAVSVLVTYADNSNERTVIATEDPFQSNFGLVPVFVRVAYVDLPLWEAYSDGVVKKTSRVFDARFTRFGSY